jgi:tetratricopeptide (TPR) repeat protein
VGYLHATQGEAARRRGEYQRAEEFYQEALKIAVEEGLGDLETEGLAHRGVLSALQARREEARRDLIRVITISKRHKDSSWAMSLTDEIVAIDRLLGAEMKWSLGMQRGDAASRHADLAFKEANVLLTEAAEIFDHIGDSRALQVRADWAGITARIRNREHGEVRGEMISTESRA